MMMMVMMVMMVETVMYVNDDVDDDDDPGCSKDIISKNSTAFHKTSDQLFIKRHVCTII